MSSLGLGPTPGFLHKLSFLLLVTAAEAGGGPETTLVVVNAESPVSRLVANEYVRLRDIPPLHVLPVEGIPHFGVIPLDLFLERIAKPLRAHLAEHGLDDRIGLVAYSADFPYGVDFRARLGEGETAKQVGHVASLTGVTYLLTLVEAGEEFWRLDANRYYRFAPPPAARSASAEERGLFMRAQAAQAQQRWAEAADAYRGFFETYDGPLPLPLYNWACCLALLGREDEALEVLGRAADAGFGDAGHAAADPDLAKLREKPGFREVLARMRPSGLRPARAFRADAGFDAKGEPDPAETVHRYLPATQLGYTGYKGNSVPEILACLRSAAAADGTRPDGTVYVCRNGDVRSKAREAFFGMLQERLSGLGRKCEVLDGVLPPAKPDVLGAVLGTAAFDWAASRSVLLPGAIAEHLTSHGADFGTAGQTKISELFRHGAAGSSGTVQEPFAIHQKFPNPLVHAFYAEGCSLAEAFYQSVAGPYQLMVAGDGLARPFATFGDVALPPGPWKGTVEVDADELWVDGRRAPLPLDTAALEDGWHDVRAVRVAPDAVGTRTSRRADVLVQNRGGPPRVRLRKEEVVAQEKGTLELLWQGRVVASSPKGKCRIPAEALGPGPVTLVPRLVRPDGTAARGEPLRVDLPPPAPLRSRAKDRAAKEGLAGTADGKPVTVPYLGDRMDGQPMRLEGVSRLELSGELEAAQEGFYELVVRGGGRLTLEVAGKRLCDARPLEGQLCLPLSLAAGWHPVRILLETGGVSHLEILMGGDRVLAPPRLRH